MGLYLNPADMTKEEWLGKHARIERNPESHKKEGYTLACWVDNGWMTAVGLCYSDAEFKAFQYDDGRPRRFLWIPDNLIGEFK